MLESSYLTTIKRKNPVLYDAASSAADLIEQPLNLAEDATTSQLNADIKAGLAWGSTVGGPWTSWTLSDLSELDSAAVTALQMLSLMLPGTPSLVGGQEVGKVGISVR